jgi:hypothetical protein
MMTFPSNRSEPELKPAIDVYAEVYAHNIVFWCGPEFIDTLAPRFDDYPGFHFREGNHGKTILNFPPNYDPITVVNWVMAIAQKHELLFLQTVSPEAQKASRHLKEISGYVAKLSGEINPD